MHGLRFLALRFFSVWGTGQRPDLALESFRRRIEAGQPVIINGDGSQRWLKSEILNPKFETKNTPPSPLFLFRLKFSAWNLGFSTTSTFHMIRMGEPYPGTGTLSEIDFLIRAVTYDTENERSITILADVRGIICSYNVRRQIDF
jgi:hypothetical protein